MKKMLQLCSLAALAIGIINGETVTDEIGAVKYTTSPEPQCIRTKLAGDILYLVHDNKDQVYLSDKCDAKWTIHDHITSPGQDHDGLCVEGRNCLVINAHSDYYLESGADRGVLEEIDFSQRPGRGVWFVLRENLFGPGDYQIFNVHWHSVGANPLLCPILTVEGHTLDWGKADNSKCGWIITPNGYNYRRLINTARNTVSDTLSNDLIDILSSGPLCISTIAPNNEKLYLVHDNIDSVSLSDKCSAQWTTRFHIPSPGQDPNGLCGPGAECRVFNAYSDYYLESGADRGVLEEIDFSQRPGFGVWFKIITNIIGEQQILNVYWNSVTENPLLCTQIRQEGPTLFWQSKDVISCVWTFEPFQQN